MSEEVFRYPTVKEVAFEIKFPHLFSIENRIGDFQEKIILQFPDSAQVLHRQVMFADTGLEGKIETVPIPEGFQPDTVRKSWVFKSKGKIEVKIQTNAVSIISQEHKTYNNPSSEEKFRDVIDFVLSNFFKVINVPIIKRIGLRYIDHCPLPSKENETLKKLYNSTFPIDKFSIKDAQSFYFNINTNRKNHKLIYQEGLIKNDKGDEVLLLDFDGFETDIASTDFLKVADELHEIIKGEYFSIIKEPVKQYMRTGKLEIE
jgi:uncharacterized protein (TIGR04255 family)